MPVLPVLEPGDKLVCSALHVACVRAAAAVQALTAHLHREPAWQQACPAARGRRAGDALAGACVGLVVPTRTVWGQGAAPAHQSPIL